MVELSKHFQSIVVPCIGNKFDFLKSQNYDIVYINLER